MFSHNTTPHHTIKIKLILNENVREKNEIGNGNETRKMPYKVNILVNVLVVNGHFGTAL